MFNSVSRNTFYPKIVSRKIGGGSFGCHGEVVESTAQFAPAFERAVASGEPALIEIRMDPDALTPRLSLTEIRANALANMKG
jgi:acetolactate synthase-1/2/3 large subunit